MKLQPSHIERLEHFLDKIQRDIYDEPDSPSHSQITDLMIEKLARQQVFKPGDHILDVGCGQGAALRNFISRGTRATGVTLSREDCDACIAQGLDVHHMDQSFLDFPDAAFDLLWCRHCLEHSIFPYFTLQGFHRIIKPGGWLYVEVPAPDTSSLHETNPNHYSVLGKPLWLSLFKRSGFTPHGDADLDLEVPLGKDRYLAFILRKA